MTSEPPSAGVTRPWTTTGRRPSLPGDHVTVEVICTSSAVVVVGPVVHDIAAEVPETYWLLEVIVYVVPSIVSLAVRLPCKPASWVIVRPRRRAWSSSARESASTRWRCVLVMCATCA